MLHLTPLRLRLRLRPLLLFLGLSRRHLHSIDLTHPTFIVYASNTAVGKTLVSAGLADSVLSSAASSSSSLYLKTVQTGFPQDPDSRFVYRKVSDLFRRRSADRRSSTALFASNHAIRASVPARKEVLGFGSEEEEGAEAARECARTRRLGLGELRARARSVDWIVGRFFHGKR